jgi:hypothetical protein
LIKADDEYKRECQHLFPPGRLIAFGRIAHRFGTTTLHGNSSSVLRSRFRQYRILSKSIS